MESIRHPRVKVTRVYTQIGSGRKVAIMKIAIKYTLSHAGQRASLLAGGNGKSTQILQLDATPELIAEANVAYDGTATIDTTSTMGWFLDEVSGEARREPYEACVTFTLSAPATTWDEICAVRDPAIEAARIKALARLPELRAATVQREADRAARAADDRAARAADRFEDEQRAASVMARNRQTAESYASGDKSVTESTGKLITRDRTHVEISRLPKDLQTRVQAEQDRRIEAAIIEDTEWIHAYGSTRLQKAVAAGMLYDCASILRDERLAMDRPGWTWASEMETDDIRNPSESALDALLAAREKFPHAELLRVGTEVDDADHGTVIEWSTVISDQYGDRRIVKAITA